MDRVHRIGQTRPVRVVRYIAEDTLEPKILEMQVCNPTQPLSCLISYFEALACSEQVCMDT